MQIGGRLTKDDCYRFATLGIRNKVKVADEQVDTFFDIQDLVDENRRDALCGKIVGGIQHSIDFSAELRPRCLNRGDGVSEEFAKMIFGMVCAEPSHGGAVDE